MSTDQHQGAGTPCKQLDLPLGLQQGRGEGGYRAGDLVDCDDCHDDDDDDGGGDDYDNDGLQQEGGEGDFDGGGSDMNTKNHL